MPRRQKPPGLEKWTWAEIRAGRKMSKGEKRMRRIAKSFGGVEDKQGNIRAPEGEDRLGFTLAMILIAITTLGAVVLAP